MGSINDVIDALRQAPTNVDRGTLFEQLMVRYFQLDPALAQQYGEVSRWIDGPGRDSKPDTGIDLVARERDTGEYTAIQCKFYEPEHTLAKGDIDSFFTASGKKPVVFPSASTAGAVALGRSCNGRREWIASDGTLFGDWESRGVE